MHVNRYQMHVQSTCNKNQLQVTTLKKIKYNIKSAFYNQKCQITLFILVRK